MNQTARKITIHCADGFPLAADLFAANEARACVIMAPALGVPKRIYAAWASYLVATTSAAPR